MTTSASSSSPAPFRSALVLHGGGGPFTVAGLAAHLGETLPTTSPTHPGWNGVELPDTVTSMRDLASLYLDELRAGGATEVLVVGSSLGGWIASEIAVLDAASAREKGVEPIVTGLVLINSTGIEVEGEPIRDFFGLDARGIAEYSWHDADKGYIDPATLPAEQLAMRAANMANMNKLGGDPYMHNPSLRAELAAVRVSPLVVWGESDRVVTPAYGRALAASFPDARFELIAEAGHLPQLEQPDATLLALDSYVAAGR